VYPTAYYQAINRATRISVDSPDNIRLHRANANIMIVQQLRELQTIDQYDPLANYYICRLAEISED
jgi:hypothetical protein